MSKPTMEITEPGIFTTVQDRGRYGYQRYGVPVSGAMDEQALRVANALVGNAQGAACLEMTVIGPQITFLGDTWITVTGADLSPSLNGEPLQQWRSVELSAGSKLSFHGMQDGMRAYLAVAGGIDVAMVMGSRSTYVKAGFGGLEGRALAKGDVISTMPLGPDAAYLPRRLPAEYQPPVYGESHEIRFIIGQPDVAFSTDAISTFQKSHYVVALDSDRMGYKLEGPPIPHRTLPDIISEGNPPGAIQVPGDGVPTILLADRGTTGGYAKIGTVIGADLGRLAQAVPGHSVTFHAVEAEEAHRALREWESLVVEILGQRQPVKDSSSGVVTILVDGEAFEAVDEDGNYLSQVETTGSSTRDRRHRARATVSGQTYEFEVETRRTETEAPQENERT